MESVFGGTKRIIFIILSIAALVALTLVASEFISPATPSRVASWLSVTGLIMTAAGLLQLEISGLFNKIAEEYHDDEKYPYGPPSRITRQIIDNPDREFETSVRNILFFDSRTGFWIIFVSTLIQIPAALP